MGLEKFPHPSLYMGIPVVSYCCHGDGSGEFIPDGDLPIANTSVTTWLAVDWRVALVYRGCSTSLKDGTSIFLAWQCGGKGCVLVSRF